MSRLTSLFATLTKNTPGGGGAGGTAIPGCPLPVLPAQEHGMHDTEHGTHGSDHESQVPGHGTRVTDMIHYGALGRTRFQHNADPVPRPQCDRCQWHHRMPLHQPESVPLRNRRESQRRFHQRERIPDALARPSSKREISKPGNPFQQVALPPFGTKFFRRVVPPRVAVHRPLRKRDARALRHRVTCNFEVIDSVMM
jgi:hypothetical protein